MAINRIKRCYIYNETEYPLKDEVKYLNKIIKYAYKIENLSRTTFNIIIVSNAKIRDINKTYRKIDKETDVISFALEDDKSETSYSDYRILGDVYISIDKALEQAQSYGHSLTRELCFLAVHGLLHLLGYDHMKKKDEEVMFAKQELILDGQRFPKVQR